MLLTCQACQAAEGIFAEAGWVVLLQVWRRQQQASGRRLQQLQERQSPPLRDLVESYAQEAGMEFLPKARQHEGLQVRANSLSVRVH